MQKNELALGDAKTVAIYGTVKNNYYQKQITVIVGEGLPQEQHAEQLILNSIPLKPKGHKYIIVSRMPCKHCIEAIINKAFHKLTLILPKQLDVTSKWYTNQVEGYKNLTQFVNDPQSTNIELVFYD